MRRASNSHVLTRKADDQEAVPTSDRPHSFSWTTGSCKKVDFGGTVSLMTLRAADSDLSGSRGPRRRRRRTVGRPNTSLKNGPCWGRRCQSHQPAADRHEQQPGRGGCRSPPPLLCDPVDSMVCFRDHGLEQAPTCAVRYARRPGACSSGTMDASVPGPHPRRKQPAVGTSPRPVNAEKFR